MSLMMMNFFNKNVTYLHTITFLEQFFFLLLLIFLIRCVIKIDFSLNKIIVFFGLIQFICLRDFKFIFYYINLDELLHKIAYYITKCFLIASGFFTMYDARSTGFFTFYLMRVKW